MEVAVLAVQAATVEVMGTVRKRLGKDTVSPRAASAHT